MPKINGYVAIYKNIKSGDFMLDHPNTSNGKVTELVCKKYIQGCKPPSYYVELSGTICKKIINYVPCLKIPSDEKDEPKPRVEIGNFELPCLLKKISVEINATKKYNPKEKEDEKLFISLKQLELIEGITYNIKYDGAKELYLLNNEKFSTRILEEKPLIKLKKPNSVNDKSNSLCIWKNHIQSFIPSNPIFIEESHEKVQKVTYFWMPFRSPRFLHSLRISPNFTPLCSRW